MYQAQFDCGELQTTRAADSGDEADDEGRVPLVAAADGSWAIRGFSSNDGQASVWYGGDEHGFPATIIAQACRGKYCGCCDYYARNHPELEPPWHLCRKNHEGSSKSMESDILLDLLEEIATVKYKNKQGVEVEREMELRLVVEAVVCDEDSTFMARCTVELEIAPVPRKISDPNHLSGCVFRALLALKASIYKGTSELSVKTIEHLCRSYR